MKDNRDPDRQFDENLRTLGRVLNDNAKPSRQTLDRCRAAFDQNGHAEQWRMLNVMKKPALLSITGIAAAIVVSVVLFFPGAGTPRVQAATILRQLDQQMSGSPTIELRIDALSVEEAYIDGFLLLSDKGIGGDLDIRVQEADDSAIEIDVALGLRDVDSWILIRKLHIPDPTVAPILELFFPEGQETVLLLPSEFGDEMSFDISTEINELNSEDIMEVLREIIASHEDNSVVLETLPDGAVRMTLPIKDAHALETFNVFRPKMRTTTTTTVTLKDASGAELSEEQVQEVLETLDDEDLAALITDGEYVEDVSYIDTGMEAAAADILIGSTMIAVYDPATEKVRSLAIRDLGGEGSCIEINLSADEPEEGWLDWDKYVTSTPRVLDLSALESMFGGMLNMEVEE